MIMSYESRGGVLKIRNHEFFYLCVALFSWWFSIVGLFLTATIAWSFKDGLGPDSVESHGRAAVLRFFQIFRVPFITMAPIFLLDCLFFGMAVRSHRRGLLKSPLGLDEFDP